MVKISIIFGTRPEIIKLALLIKLFKETPQVDLNVCFTGQHKEMVIPLLNFFNIQTDHSLNIMQPDQTLAGISSTSLKAIDEYYDIVKPNLVFVQGDTSTALNAAIAAFYKKIKIAHVEAGLRTYDLDSPFPEEFNRQVISKIASLNFAPTELSKDNLINEHILSNKIFITGNTVIDSLLYTIEKLKQKPIELTNKFKFLKDDLPFILVTMHRRENFGDSIQHVCEALKELSQLFPDYNFIYPVHLNPNVQEPVYRLLKNINNIFLIDPLDYIDFTYLMSKCYLILSDSGGVQEEAPSLGKPLLILRENTERSEVLEVGAAKLIGTNKEVIIKEVKKLIEDKSTYEKMSNCINPFGDGEASKRIVRDTLNYMKA